MHWAICSGGGEVGLVHGRAEVGYCIKGSAFLTIERLSQKFMPTKPEPAADIAGTGIEFLADLNMGFVTCVVGLGDHSSEDRSVDFFLYIVLLFFILTSFFIVKLFQNKIHL